MISAEARLWTDLEPAFKVSIAGTLVGLYGAIDDESAFESLAVDKQQALLLLVKRFETLELWRMVVRVENVYGLGGVGFDFVASPELETMLLSSAGFTTRFAGHHDNSIGFFERRRTWAPLHLIRKSVGRDCWGGHFDLFSPVDSVRSVIGHLFYEKLLGKTPDWIEITKRV